MITYLIKSYQSTWYYISAIILFPFSFLLINAPASDKVVDINPPHGYKRNVINEQSFASYLRQLELKPKGTKVKYYNGSLKLNQNAHYRIIDLDIGSRNLQQCADAIIRLRAEYFYSIGDFKSIHFNFTSGDTAKYLNWIQGYRPQVKNNHVDWIKSHPPDESYISFRKYLDTVFMYSGSYSLKKELLQVPDLNKIEIGDVFIQGGFPGHAVIVIDMARSLTDGKIAILLAQSYMPAQDIHILVNQNDSNLSPWYIVGRTDKLYTPEWTFDWCDLYRFK